MSGHENGRIARNRETVLAFLRGTHSVDIEDVDVIDTTVAERFACHGFPGFPGGEFSDHASYKAFFRIFRQSFADMAFRIDALVADETFVAVRWEIDATHVGRFAGIEPTGRRFTFDGMVLYRMEEGLIAETWLHINETRLLAAIGALPAMAA